MAQVRWAQQAAEDLEAIAQHIACDSPHYAKLLVLDVLAAVSRAGEFPQIGRVVPELGDPLIREILLGSYRMICRTGEDLVEVLTIYHSARLLDPYRLSSG